MKAYARQSSLRTIPTSQNRTRSSAQAAPASRTAASGDHRPEAIAQRQWPGTINHSPRVVAQAQWRVLIDHSPRQMAQRQRMEGLFGRQRQAGRGADALRTPTASATPLQAVIQRYPRIVSGPTYSGGAGGLAGTSKLGVRLDGTTYDEGYNFPTTAARVGIPGLNQLVTAGKVGDYAMHLVNGRLGGSGADVSNLAWGSPKHNREHNRRFELDMQNDARDARNNGKQMNIEVSAAYHPADLAVPWKEFFLHALTCKYEIPGGHVSLAGQPVVVAEQFTEDIDDQAYDDAIGDVMQHDPADDEVVAWNEYHVDPARYGRGQRASRVPARFRDDTRGRGGAARRLGGRDAPYPAGRDVVRDDDSDSD
jgi:hypothetical protein